MSKACPICGQYITTAGCGCPTITSYCKHGFPLEKDNCYKCKAENLKLLK